MNFQTNKLNKFLKISLDSADLVETFDILNPFTEGLGLGIRNYPRYIRQGVKEVINLKQENMQLKDELEFAQDELKGYREVISIDDLDNLTDEYKEKIKRFFEELGEGRMKIKISNQYAFHEVATNMSVAEWETKLKQITAGNIDFITVEDIKDGRTVTICPKNCAVIEVKE